MVAPRPHGQTAEAFRRELQRLRTAIANAGGGGGDVTSAEFAALEARVTALEAATNWELADGLWHWNADAEPASPGATSLYFPTSSWTGFTEWDPGSTATWDVDTTRRLGRAACTGNGGIRWTGMYAAIPASEFVVYTQCNLLTQYSTSGAAAGLFVAGDIVGSPTTADFRTLDTTRVAGLTLSSTVRARDWDAYNGTPSSTDTAPAGPYPYLRMRVSGTTVHSDISANGLDWAAIGSTSRTVGFTPAYYGVVALEVTNGVTSQALFRYILTASGAGTSAYDYVPPAGRGIALPIFP